MLEKLKFWNKAPSVGVGVFAFRRGSGEFLYAKRLAGRGKGTLAIPGGRVDPGESLVECGLREMYEETGILATEPMIFDSVEELIFNRLHITFFMGAVVEDYIPPNPEPNLHGNWSWINWPDFAYFGLKGSGLNLFGPNQKLIDRYVEQHNIRTNNDLINVIRSCAPNNMKWYRDYLKA